MDALGHQQRQTCRKDTISVKTKCQRKQTASHGRHKRRQKMAQGCPGASTNKKKGVTWTPWHEASEKGVTWKPWQEASTLLTPRCDQHRFTLTNQIRTPLPDLVTVLDRNHFGMEIRCGAELCHTRFSSFSEQRAAHNSPPPPMSMPKWWLAEKIAKSEVGVRFLLVIISGPFRSSKNCHLDAISVNRKIDRWTH